MKRLKLSVSPLEVSDESFQVGQQLAFILGDSVRLQVLLAQPVIVSARARSEVTARVREQVVRAEGREVEMAHLPRIQPTARGSLISADCENVRE